MHSVHRNNIDKVDTLKLIFLVMLHLLEILAVTNSGGYSGERGVYLGPLVSWEEVSSGAYDCATSNFTDVTDI